MRRNGNFVIVLVLATMLVITPVYGAATMPGANSGQGSAIDVEHAAEYLAAIMEFILNNYVGKQVSAEMLYEAAARGMTDPLDQYTEFLSSAEYDALIGGISGNFEGIGIQFSADLDGSIVVQKVFESSPAQAAGILKGDIIHAVNGKTVSGYTDNSLSSMIAALDGKIKLEIQRGSAKLHKTVEKAEIHMTTVEYGKLGDFLSKAKNAGTLGYIGISQIGERSATEVREAITALKAIGVTGVVIDLRGNPGGLKNVIEDISKMLVPKGTIFSTIDKAGKRVTYTSTLESQPFKKICILVDGETASASELFASAMQDAKAAVIIGSDTFGKGIIQSFAGLPSGDTLKYTSMEYLRRSGQRLNGIGIKPDIYIKQPALLSSSIFTLHNDGSGDDVPELKAILRYMGYNIASTTAKYDDQTRNAVKDIQQKAKLNQTGQLDIETVKAINTSFGIYCDTHDEALKTAYSELRK